MWPFNKKYSLRETGVFNGWTDCHSHILPGVDDGIQHTRESLAILALYEELGVEKVWLTPHIMEDCPNETEHLRHRFRHLTDAYYGEGLNFGDAGAKGKIELRLAAENMIDSLFTKRLADGDVMPYGDNGNQLLVETSYVQPPVKFMSILKDIKAAGYYPVLAHPERYHYMDYEQYDSLHSQGVLFQLNLPSLVGAYGKEVKQRAEYILENDFYAYQGSDVHSLHSLQRAIDEKALRSKHLEF